MTIEAGEFHCWYSADIGEARRRGQYMMGTFGKYLKGRVVDLGCGEGTFLLALLESGRKDLLGVESNKELADLAESWGVPIARKDLLGYLREEKLEAGTYVYTDVIEHVPFEVNLEVLSRLPAGSRIIIQTPNTESVLGHQYYFNVPSHVAAYSPHVIQKMLTRHGYRVVAEGSLDGRHPDNWKRKVRELVIRKMLAINAELILGGGNYFVVADRAG